MFYNHEVETKTKLSDFFPPSLNRIDVDVDDDVTPAKRRMNIV
jgi:hypothetical protein